MKHLIILRHAKSNWDIAYDGDINRPITSHGKMRAEATGELLKQKSIEIDFALVSSANRTNQTFDAFQKGYGKKIEYQIKRDIYDGDLNKILSLVQKTANNYQSLMLVGHQPTCSFFTEKLLKKVDFEIVFKTATIAKIDFELDSWRDVNWLSGSLDWLTRAD